MRAERRTERKGQSGGTDQRVRGKTETGGKYILCGGDERKEEGKQRDREKEETEEGRETKDRGDRDTETRRHRQ